jgi:hypothetical protein
MTILEWLDAVTPLIIAIATVVYATLTYFLLREQRREKKKPVIEEMLKVVIHPLLKDVQNEIQFLRQNKFKWYHTQKRTVYHELEPRKSGVEGIVYENFAIAYPRIPLLLNHHDVEFHHLKDSLESLANKLLSAGFKEKCMELITEYNKSAKRATLSDSDVNYLLMFVIDNTKEVVDAHVAFEFWNLNGAQLLNFRERADVKEFIKTVESNAGKILHTCEELEAEMKRLINQFRDDYGIEIAGPKKVEAL